MKKKNKCDYDYYLSIADYVKLQRSKGITVTGEDILDFQVKQLVEKCGFTLCDTASYIKPDQAKPGDTFIKDDLPF